MTAVVGIALAGSLGALARYGVDGLVSQHTHGAFPWGTFVVNVSGSFALGFLFVLLAERSTLDPSVRSAITIGFLGAYTTFSTLRSRRIACWRTARAPSVRKRARSVAAALVAVYLGVVAARVL